MIDRRTLLLVAGGAALAGCVQPGPGAVTIAASGQPGMNRGPDGADRPITLTVVQLRGTGSFDGADFFALQNPSGALGGDLVKAEQIILQPGASASKVIALDPSTSAVGVIAGFRDPAGKTFRARTAVSPTATVTLAVTVSSNGVTLAGA